MLTNFIKAQSDQSHCRLINHIGGGGWWLVQKIKQKKKESEECVVRWNFENILQTNFVDLETPKINMVPPLNLRSKKNPFHLNFLHPFVINYESPLNRISKSIGSRQNSRFLSTRIQDSDKEYSTHTFQRYLNLSLRYLPPH